MRFKDIRLANLQAVVDNSGKAYPTRKTIKTLFNCIFKFAIMHDIVEKDYAKYVNIGKDEGKANKTPFTEDEIEKLWENVDKLEFVDTALILIYTGLRIRRTIGYENRKCAFRRKIYDRWNENRGRKK